MSPEIVTLLTEVGKILLTASTVTATIAYLGQKRLDRHLERSIERYKSELGRQEHLFRIGLGVANNSIRNLPISNVISIEKD